MGLTRALATVRESRGADPTLPWGSSYIPTNGQIGFTAAGVPMNDDSALSIDTVASCIRLLVNTVAALPLVTLKRTKDKSKRIVDPPALIQSPWPEGTRQDWVSQIVFSLALRGNFFGQIVDRDGDGYPTMIMPVHPDDVIAYRERGNGRRIYKFKNQFVPLQDVFHIPSEHVPPGGFIGLNPVEYRRTSWALEAAASRYGGQLFANSANPSGILSISSDLPPDEAREMALEWRATHGGIGNAHLPAILTGGTTWQQVSLSNEDAQFLQTRGFQREQIIAWFGIPPHKIGITDRTPTSGQTAEDLERAFINDAIVGPYTSRIEAYLSQPTITRPSQVVHFDFTDRLRANVLQLAQTAQIMVNTGQWMPDESRDFFDMEPLPNNLGRVVGRPMNNSYFDADSGDLLNQPDPGLKPPNPGGLGDGGGDPNGSPNPTTPAGS